MKKQHGLTLIEVVIVMAITAILASISVPSYSRYIAREKLRTVQSDLEVLSLKFENRYQRVLSYPASDVDDTSTLKAQINGWVPSSATDEINFSSENSTRNSYTLKATGTAGSLKDCVVTLTHEGNKLISNCDSLAADGTWI